MLLPRLRAAARRQRLLDLGTGSGQVPAAVTRAAARAGVRVDVYGVDRKLSHLLFGRARGHRQHRVVAAVQALPFADGAFDWSLSTLLLHHFHGDAARTALAEMLRVARRGAIVVDLRRSRLARGLFRLAAIPLRLGRVALHDGLLSVRQASTLAEIRQLAEGLPVVELRRRLPFRLSLVLEPPAADERQGPRQERPEKRSKRAADG